MWKKSAIWQVLAVFALNLVVLVLSDMEFSFTWFIVGFTFSFVVGFAWGVAKQCQVKWTSDLLIWIYLIGFLLTFLAGHYLDSSEPFTFSLGMLLATISELVVYQMHLRKSVTWDDLKPVWNKDKK